LHQVKPSKGSTMKLSKHEAKAGRLRFGVASLAVLGLLVAFPLSAQAAQPPVGLGTAASYAILAGSTITNTGNSTITGDIGVSPGAAITGFPPGTVTGATHAADTQALQAKADLTTAYGDAFGRTPVTAIPVELAGQTLKPGVYSGGTLGLSGALTLDAGGDPNAVFIFKAASTLITGPGSRVNLINGASSCNVFWQVTSSATLGAGSTFRGTILALTDINLNAGATVDGRVLAQTGQVTLITDTIRTLPCVIGATTTATPRPQVTAVPTGAVASGDGSTSGGGNDAQGLLAAALLFAAFGGAGVVAARRRRLNT
jgi:hypothetical protein